uniref:Carbamoyl phosphate synthase small chain n=1 Tax=Yamadaella caenomyce TaxID=259029 RepID=A0A1G4NYI3_9FLOR|nr:Carbamoyl phosphate synthase small subunit [Yamadaella caenomyce]SCW23718.1 Carbamoyl phosphate synthase small subunit [Yamadaella caenomyce]
MKTTSYKAVLILEDNTRYYGWSLTEQNTAIGEVVFNTGMTGYQEVITDPSYTGQIITFTYPELGNTGFNNLDNESSKPSISGIIAKNFCVDGNNWRAEQTLYQYITENSIVHIYGIDTRSLTKHLRQFGSMNGCISNNINGLDSDVLALHAYTPMQGKDIVQQVSTKRPYTVSGMAPYFPFYCSSFSSKVNQQNIHKTKRQISIVIIDLGLKYNILRNLHSQEDSITMNVVPATSDIEDILSFQPDGIVLSNGPGDPKAVNYVINNIQILISSQIPIFGICMGHQLLGIALGLQTFKMQFGHRGLNHPVGRHEKVNITSQNHGFAVLSNRSKDPDLITNEFNYNDNTVASITHRTLPVFGVQYHPEASPGPHDTANLFQHFIKIIQLYKTYPELRTTTSNTKHGQ